MRKRRCILEGGRISSLSQVYDELARQLRLPGYFGRNLDALWDVLAGGVGGPIEIVWRDAQASRSVLGSDFGRLVAVLRKAEAARPDLVVRLE